MTFAELLEEIQIELKFMETTVRDVVALSEHISDRDADNWALKTDLTGFRK